MELKPSDLGEIQATGKGSFLMKCRLLRIFDFFSSNIYTGFPNNVPNPTTDFNIKI